MDTSNTTYTIANCPATVAVCVMVKNYSSDIVDPACSNDEEPKNYLVDSAGSSDVVPKKRYDKANIRALIDAAIRASLHAEQCGVQARSAFDKYTLALAHADNDVPRYAVEARRTFDVYTTAVTNSLEEAATSDAAIAVMTADIESRIEALLVEP